MAARMLRWHRKQLDILPNEAWQAYRVYLAVKCGYRDEDIGQTYVENLESLIARHIDEDASIPWQVLKIELNLARKLLTYPTYVEDEPEVDERKYQPYSQYEAQEQLGEQAYEATRYSGPRHGDWRICPDYCDVCCEPILGWDEVNETQKEVDGVHWKHDRLELIKRLEADWKQEQLAALQAWQDGMPTIGDEKRCEKYSRVIDRAHESLLDAPSWW